MPEDETLLNIQTAISEDQVVKIIEKWKNHPQKPLNKEILTLLSNKNAVRYFKYNVKQYCELHSLFLNVIEDKSEFIDFLKNENAFQKVIRERDDFYVGFFENLLPSLITASAKFEESHVFGDAAQIVQKCIFSRNYKEFECYLNDQFGEKKCSEKHSLCKALFKFISSLYSQEELSDYGFKLIFQSFASSYKNFGLTYKMLVVLIQMIGFDLKDNFNINKLRYQVAQTSVKKSLSVIDVMFSVIAKIKTELDYKINDVTFTDFMKYLLKSVIATTDVPSDCCYNICLTIIEINPLIVESVVNELITYAMLSDNSCNEKYEVLIIKIFEVYSRLHRIQNFISKMVPTLKSGIDGRDLGEPVYTFRGELDPEKYEQEYSVETIFPKSVLNYFTTCIINLASWQIINLFKTLLFHLKKAVEELPDVKGDKKNLVYMEILSTLTCWVLSSVRMAEHTVASSTVEKFVGGLEELRSILGTFGTTLLHKEHNHILMRTFLNMCYSWGEICIALEYYSIDNKIKMKKNIDNNFSTSNLSYLHTYLSGKEWCLIEERISNFGEKPCKKIMQKLLIQKYKTILLFENTEDEDITAPIIQTLSSNFDNESVELFTDKFVVNYILEKMPSSVIISLAEVMVRDLVMNKATLLRQSHIHDSQLITSSVLTVIFTKINKLLKQKRKHDEDSVKKVFYSRIFANMPADGFLTGDIDNLITAGVDIVSCEEETQTIDLKLNESKIQTYVEILKELPIIFCTASTQKVVTILLLALHRDISNSNCDQALKKTSENLIISIVQHHKFNLTDCFEAGQLLKVLAKNFERYADLFVFVAHNVFKSDVAIVGFEPGIEFIKDNLKEDKCLSCAIIVLNLLNKVKKTKLSAASKELCLKYKWILCDKIVKVTYKRSPENRLIEPYAIVLKTFLAKDEHGAFSKLKLCLNGFIEYCLSNLCDDNLKGSLLLFATILHHKTILSDFKEDLVLKIWDSLKPMTIGNDVLEEYSQLIMLIASLIPNEQFSDIFGDLLKVTAQAIDLKDHKTFYKHLKTWVCILSTNFNTIKTNILREQLELLLEKLIFTLKCVDYQEDLFEEILQFEISIIQANHIPLTAAIMDYLMLSVTISTMKQCEDFVHIFNFSISLMENLFKHRNPLIMDRLPPYLLQYRVLLKELCLRSGSNANLEPNEIQKISDCAHKLEKLTKSLVECTKDMSRIAMYLIADILGQYELDTVYPNVKKHLNNCIYSLISLCDQHAVQYLMRILSNASTEIFKFMYENYKKYYRFTGKV